MAKQFPLIKNPPFNPVVSGPYSSSELLDSFKPDDPLSITRTLDFKSYAYFQQQGRTTIRDPYASMMEALHDASIVRGMNVFLSDAANAGRRPVAIMGGHNEPRGSDEYMVRREPGVAVPKIGQRTEEES